MLTLLHLLLLCVQVYLARFHCLSFLIELCTVLLDLFLPLLNLEQLLAHRLLDLVHPCLVADTARVLRVHRLQDLLLLLARHADHLLSL